MKINQITAALLSLGLISAASVAKADTQIVLTSNGQTYNVVYITGSTAARPNVFNAVTNGVFDQTPPTLQPTTASGSTSQYNAIGTIGGVNYIISADFTGSEAGLGALQHFTTDPTILQNPNTASSLPGYSSGTVYLPGTPNPSFINPNNTSQTAAAQADLSMADTSQAVSLTAPPAYTALKNWGIVGVVPFEWVKATNSAPDSSWTDLVNVTDPQLNFALGSVQAASFFTGNANDSDSVYLIGRNKGSGTRVNCMLDTLHGVTSAVNQYCAGNAAYNGSGAITNGSSSVTLKVAGGIVALGNDGFDSGSGVSGTLSMDVNGTTDTYGQIMTIGYLGISDGNTAAGNHATRLTLNGVPENDATVINGTYSFWGHEHLYSTPSPDSTVTTVAEQLVGANANSSPNQSLGSGSTAAGAIESKGGLGGNEVNTSTTQSTIIDPKAMAADKASGDAGYPSQI
jgi:hypothetical protein